MEEVLPALPFRRLCPCALNPSGPACKRSIEFSDLKMVMHSIGIHAHESGAAWASPPAQAIIRNGATIKDERGKVVYSPLLLQFGSVEVRHPWSDRVVAEVLKFDPARARMPRDVMTEWHTEITVFEKSGGPLTKRIPKQEVAQQTDWPVKQ